MKKYILRIENTLLLSLLLHLLIEQILLHNSVLDISIHDNYFIVPTTIIPVIITTAISYFAHLLIGTKSIKNRIATAHIILTLVIFCVWWYSFFMLHDYTDISLIGNLDRVKFAINLIFRCIQSILIVQTIWIIYAAIFILTTKKPKS
jgi:hypothetical protein